MQPPMIVRARTSKQPHAAQQQDARRLRAHCRAAPGPAQQRPYAQPSKAPLLACALRAPLYLGRQRVGAGHGGQQLLSSSQGP